ncbi:hypothetical protein QBC39DRAFT_170530 [Podospora conica]|nr:hypothetical protein QBC39DRAFT_170530 [Schizothecium conicum]
MSFLPSPLRSRPPPPLRRSVRASAVQTGRGAVPSSYPSPERERARWQGLSSAFRRGYISCVFVCVCGRMPSSGARAPIIPSSLHPHQSSFCMPPLLGPGLLLPFLVDSQCLPRLQACRARLDVMVAGHRRRGRRGEQDPGRDAVPTRRALLFPPPPLLQAKRISFPFPFPSSFPSPVGSLFGFLSKKGGSCARARHQVGVALARPAISGIRERKKENRRGGGGRGW